MSKVTTSFVLYEDTKKLINKAGCPIPGEVLRLALHYLTEDEIKKAIERARKRKPKAVGNKKATLSSSEFRIIRDLAFKFRTSRSKIINALIQAFLEKQEKARRG